MKNRAPLDPEYFDLCQAEIFAAGAHSKGLTLDLSSKGAAMRRIGIVAVIVALAACGGSSSAPATHFASTLSAANESPATTSSGTATASYTVIGSVGYTNTGANISYAITFNGLTTPASAAQIQVGAAGTNGTAAISLTPPAPAGTSGTITGTFSAANIQAASGGGVNVGAGSMDDLLAAMRAGNTYTNITTSGSVNGEIRGQNQPQ